MKRATLLSWIGGFLLLSIAFSGCGGGGGGVTAPANPPQLIEGTTVVIPPEVYPGATVVLEIGYIDLSSTMNEGIAYISHTLDGQTKTYQGLISNAPGSEGTLVTSFDLSPFVPPGELWLSVFVQNSNGSSSQSILVLLTVLGD
ncbi:hypothetical protein CSA56_05665 [candidate division KSB3 bacterium]|uniref:Bacterial spore germination immunoglobulin-like domain-containing protein n=1 Tax=candidate division KSB3 bacterium TaxID=2044937 RepID=A0A2G6KHC8_9BACT|nr:MAG: hypothetical protein CSA56_05665 [candidate division KSB3 bacterium]